MATTEPLPQSAAANPFALLQEQVQRRQAIADALQGQALGPQEAPGQMVSGHYINTALGDNVRKIASLLISQRMKQQNLGNQQQLYGQYNQSQQAEVGKYLEDYQKDPAGAPVRGMASWSPAVQAIAKEHLSKGISQKDLLDSLKGATPASLAAFQKSGNPADLVKRETVDPTKPQGELVSGAAGPQVQVAQGAPQFAPAHAGPNGSVIQTNPVTGQAEGIHAGTFVSVANMAPNVAASEKVKSFFGPEGLVTKSLSGAQGTQRAVLGLQLAKDALNRGIFNNPGASAAAEYKRIMTLLGQTPDDKLANNQQFEQAVISSAGAVGHELAGSRVPIYDEQLAQRAAGGDPSLTKGEKARAIDISLMKGVNALQQHNQLVDKASKEDPSGSSDEAFKIAVPTIDQSQYEKGDDGFLRMKTPPAAAPVTQPLAPPPGLMEGLPKGATYVGPYTPPTQ